jgi:hypothetical protein
MLNKDPKKRPSASWMLSRNFFQKYEKSFDKNISIFKNWLKI